MLRSTLTSRTRSILSEASTSGEGVKESTCVCTVRYPVTYAVQKLTQQVKRLGTSIRHAQPRARAGHLDESVAQQRRHKLGAQMLHSYSIPCRNYIERQCVHIRCAQAGV